MTSALPQSSLAAESEPADANGARSFADSCLDGGVAPVPQAAPTTSGISGIIPTNCMSRPYIWAGYGRQGPQSTTVTPAKAGGGFKALSFLPCLPFFDGSSN